MAVPAWHLLLLASPRYTYPILGVQSWPMEDSLLSLILTVSPPHSIFSPFNYVLGDTCGSSDGPVSIQTIPSKQSRIFVLGSTVQLGVLSFFDLNLG